MRVLLLNPPGKEIIRTGRLVRRSKVHTQGWAPILLAGCAGVLEQEGFDVKLYDSAISGDDGYDLLTWIREWNPEAVIYYWAYDTRVQDLAYAERLAQERRVILVGPWSAHYPEALADCPHVEAATFGQFEYTVPKLLRGERAWGVKYADGSYVSPREPYNRFELDRMPFTSDVYQRHLPYRKYYQTSLRHPFIDIFTGEPGSCPHRCSFCSWTNGYMGLHPKRWQTRSLSRVMEELWFIKHRLPDVRQVFLQDSTLPSPWAREISQRILDEGLKLCWGAYSRADKDYETLRLMRDAGCRTLHVGYEMPIQSVLDEILKDITVEQMEAFIRDVNRVGLWTSSSFMVFPWNSPEQIEYMISWVKRNGATRINVAQLQAYPHAPIMDAVERHRAAGEHMMGFDEMRTWEQRCFREFYVGNPRFWWTVATSPRELWNTVRDGWGLLRFLRE
jgi:anaerobic magnesium-protoporphyrin IX monomethyl ester cyclase